MVLAIQMKYPQCMEPFKEDILSKLLEKLKSQSEVLAVWEMGSAATGTSDEYSDVDLVILSHGQPDENFEKLEKILRSFSNITHMYIETAGSIESYKHRVYFLEGAPKYFYLDVGILNSEDKSTLSELLNSDRHGTPIVHFDKTEVIQTTRSNLELLKEEHQKRVTDSKAAFPIIFNSIMKELDRNNHVDAFAFYFGLLKRYIELLGIKYRPLRYDFGMRYTSRDFPSDVYNRLNRYVFISDPEELRPLAIELEKDFCETLKTIENGF